MHACAQRLYCDLCDRRRQGDFIEGHILSHKHAKSACFSCALLGFCSTGASDVKLKRTPKPIAKKRRALTRCLQRGWRQKVATMQARQIAQCNLTSYVTWTLLKVTCFKIEINNALKRFYSCKPSTFYKPQTFPDIFSTVASFFSLFCLLTRHN